MRGRLFYADLSMNVNPQSPKPIDRRKVLKYGAGFGLALAWPNSKVVGANDDIRVGVIGVNSRGKGHLGAYQNAGRCDL